MATLKLEIDTSEAVKKLEEIKAGIEKISNLQADAARYRWLRDNKHLDSWWSVQGPLDRCENIDADIDEAMSEGVVKEG